MDNSTLNIENNIQSERAKRVRSLRNLTGLARDAFQEKTSIPAASLQNWESSNSNGLTKKGALRMLEACEKLGIYCSLEWLMFGTGQGPGYEKNLDLATQSEVNHDFSIKQTALIEKELATFQQHYPLALHMIATDDSMNPMIEANDWVAGNPFNHYQLEKALNNSCIIRLPNAKLVVRYLKKGSVAGRYHLICLNALSDSLNYYDVEIKQAAPILWWRRPALY